MKFYTLYHKQLGHYLGNGSFSKTRPDWAKKYREISHVKAAYNTMAKAFKKYGYTEYQVDDLVILEFEATCTAKFNLGDLL